MHEGTQTYSRMTNYLTKINITLPHLYLNIPFFIFLEQFSNGRCKDTKAIVLNSRNIKKFVKLYEENERQAKLSIL